MINEAVKILKEGGIVIYPTETAFGIGCRMDNFKSVKRLFKIRKRPANQATPVLVDSVKMAEKYWASPIPDNVRQLIKTYWPGALTIIYPCIKKKVFPLVRGGGNNLGLRMPNHKIILEIIKRVGIPILGPSANFHGKPTPYNFDDIDDNLLKSADFVVTGECRLKQASTVIDCSVEPLKIIRQGVVEIKLL